ncbi:sensor histidine kinase [Paenibacillus sp. CF384]|uniref:sensor histidine kinase n=1 Tax=Paenibacillus sp. CF384 TaxID=1884382 RepID=UPI000895ACDC|nr:HAMP domain-containing protein [Paenibacillus sp. CF384]SDW47756.1 two-component system, sensor histidine kinase YesM [Paenibacillus sp. CF384]
MKSSIRKKMILFLLAATILPISISMYMACRISTSSISDHAIEENSKLLYQGKTNLHNYLELFKQLSLSVYYENLSNQTFTLFKIIRDGVTIGNDRYMKESEMNKTLRSMAKTNPDIYQIRLNVDKDKRTYLLVNDLIRSETNVRSPFGNSADRKPSGSMEASHTSHTYGIDERIKFPYYAPKTVVSLHRPILDLSSEKQIGFLSIDITLDFIRSVGEMLYGGSEELWILDGQDQVVYSSDERRIGDKLQENWAIQASGTTMPHGQYRSHSGSFDGIILYEKLKTPYVNWTIVKRIPYSHLYLFANQMSLIHGLIFGCFLIISAAATIYISYRITKPIKQLNRSIQVMQAGNPQIRIPINSQDEIGVFSRKFRELMDQIDHLLLREYRLEVRFVSDNVSSS